MMMRLFPDLFSRYDVHPVEHYPDLLLETLRAVAPAGVRDPDRGAADPGRLQQRLLRAQLPRPADGRRAGRGPGPLRQGRHRVHAHHPGAAAGGCDLPAAGRRLPRPRGLPRRFDARRARADVGLPRRPGDAGQRGRHRGGRRQVDLPLRARDGALLPRRGADPQQRAHLHAARARRPRLHARPPARAGGQGGPRRRRLRHAGGAGGDEGRDRGVPPAHPRRAGEVHRPAHAGAVDLPDLRRRRHRAAPHRPAPLRAVGRQARSAWCRAGSPGSRSRPARWWSIPRRAGAPRTPGWWADHARHPAQSHKENPHAEPNRRPPLLDGALHRARREHRAHARRVLPHVAAARRQRRRHRELVGHPRHQRAVGGLRTHRPAAVRLRRDRVRRARPRQPLERLELPARRARERARGARHADRRDVGDHQRHLARDPRHDAAEAAAPPTWANSSSG